jgi:uncharacterized membrane protein YozB (DUF420 family)
LLNDVLATVAFVLIVAGWTQRRRRSRHVPLVLAGIGLDFGMVVFLEATRHVVEEVAGVDDHVPFPAVRWAHIATSTVAVALYVPTLVYGFRMVRGDASPVTRHRHTVVATLALVFRTVGFVCMWAVELTKTRT